ncbi:MAG: tRNA wybutosine-synthesizing 3 family protein [Nanoarchaeota archaeon]
MDSFDVKKDKAFSLDRSNKGSFDSGIKDVVMTINSLTNFFTTSSCAGRLVVIKKLGKKTNSKILFCSHEKVKEPENIIDVLENDGNVWLIFQPAILHVSSRNIEDAIWLFGRAKQAGFKRTGIVSIKTNPVVEIMGTDYIETLLCDSNGRYYTYDGLKKHLEYAEEKFDKNQAKIDSFGRLLEND